MTEYVVQKGDTIAEITRRFHTTWSRIRETNPHAVGRLRRSKRWFLREGAVLKLDSAPSPERPDFHRHWVHARGHRVYRVRPGDTLWKLSRRYHVSVRDLVEINHLDDPDRIRAGQCLLIPSSPRARAGSAVSPPPHAMSESGTPDPDREWRDALAGDIFPMPLYEAGGPAPGSTPIAAETAAPEARQAGPPPSGRLFSSPEVAVGQGKRSPAPPCDRRRGISLCAHSGGGARRLRIRFSGNERVGLFTEIGVGGGGDPTASGSASLSDVSLQVGISISF